MCKLDQTTRPEFSTHELAIIEATAKFKNSCARLNKMDMAASNSPTNENILNLAYAISDMRTRADFVVSLVRNAEI